MTPANDGMSQHAGVNPLVMDDFGVNWEASGDLSDIEVLTEAFMDEVRAKNRSQWRLGDIYAFTDNGQRAGTLEEALSPSDLSLGTVQNYASVCRAWHKSMRVVPVSFSHYTATTKLVKVDPVAAMKILADCKTHGLDRNYARDEAAKALDEYTERVQLTLVYDRKRGGWFTEDTQPDWIGDGYKLKKTIKREKVAA